MDLVYFVLSPKQEYKVFFFVWFEINLRWDILKLNSFKKETDKCLQD